jgi:hypothetical protein
MNQYHDGKEIGRTLTKWRPAILLGTRIGRLNNNTLWSLLSQMYRAQCWRGTDACDTDNFGWRSEETALHLVMRLT